MRATTLIREMLGVTGLVVDDFRFDPDGLVVSVHPLGRTVQCGTCGRAGSCYDRRPARRWRHLGIGELRIWLEYAPRRVSCSWCDGVRTERVPWAPQGGRFTWDFEELVAYLAQVSDATKVTKLMGIAWRTVGAIVTRIIAHRLDPTRLDDLRRIGIDEFSYRKYHRYLTTVVDHDRRRVVWAAPGRSAETLGAFFDELGAERTVALECVTMDMAEGYRKGVEERAPNAGIVYDRFHVQRLASDALDEVRRAEVRAAGKTPEGRAIKGTRHALLKRPWNLTRKDKEKLSVLQKTNARLYRGYLLLATLAEAMDYKQPGHARRALEDWLAWASRSKLKPFVKVARTIRRHFKGVVAYFRERLTNGLVEGINNKLRMVARRAFGFHSPPPLISMLFLCCGDIQLNPPLPSPT